VSFLQFDIVTSIQIIFPFLFLAFLLFFVFLETDGAIDTVVATTQGVSVLLPVKNGAAFIRSALDSILSQRSSELLEILVRSLHMRYKARVL
jgi:hypothetical protein